MMMKVLFICSARVENGSLVCPSWIKALAGNLPESVSLVIAGEGKTAGGRTVCKTGARDVAFFSFALSGTEEHFAAAIASEKPDAAVIFGTEKTYTLFAVKSCRRAGLQNRTALFAQGIALACAEHYREGVPQKVVRRKTFRDLARRSNILKEQKNMFAAAEREKQAIAMTRHFIGRTVLDRTVQRLYHPTAAYYKCGDLLRAPFYQGSWRFEDCTPQRIFVSQYYYPLKGFHYLLKAAALLKDKYPALTIAAAGYNPVLGAVDQNELKDSSYIRYIKDLIRRLGLADRVELLGELDEEQMKREYLKANVFALPSTIENSPNSLGEAMLLGVPCVAADVGGVSDFAVHKRDAYLYPSPAYYLLAQYIDAVFSDAAAAAQMGANAQKRAAVDYNAETNSAAFADILLKITHSDEKS